MEEAPLDAAAPPAAQGAERPPWKTEEYDWDADALSARPRGGAGASADGDTAIVCQVRPLFQGFRSPPERFEQ